MLNKPKPKKLSYYQNKADKLLQELGRKTQQYCEVCGKPMSCLHHYFPKSMAGVLRYNLKNCIALCAGCHLRHHSGDPRIHSVIKSNRGEDWEQELLLEKRAYFKPSIGYYKDIIEKFNLILK